MNNEKIKTKLVVLGKGIIILLVIALIGIIISLFFELKIISGFIFLASLVISSFYIGRYGGQILNIAFSVFVSMIIAILINKISKDYCIEFIGALFSIGIFVIMYISGIIEIFINYIRKKKNEQV